MKKKSSSHKKEQRSWPVTITAGITTVAALAAAVLVFVPRFPDVLMSVTLLFFAVLALIIAVEGRKKTLRDLFESVLYLP